MAGTTIKNAGRLGLVKKVAERLNRYPISDQGEGG